MGIAERLRSLDDRVLGRPTSATSRTHLASLLIGLVGTIGLLSYATVDGDTGVLAGSGGFFGFLVAGGLRSFRAWQRERRLQRPDPVMWMAAGAGLLLVALILGWYGFLFSRADDEPRFSREQCEVARSGFLSGDSGGVIDEILRECAEDGR